MLDVHIIHAIGNTLGQYRTEGMGSLFKEVSEAYQARLLEYLNQDIALDSAFQNRDERLPLIVVQQSEARLGDRFLGQVSPSTDTHTQKHIMTDKTCSISIAAAEMDMVRLLHRIVQAAMIRNMSSFLDAGYQNIMYGGSAPFQVNNEIISKSRVVYGRVLRWSSLHLLEIEDTTISEYDIVVGDF